MSVSITNVTKDFDRTPALYGVSLEIARGELVALLGPSGSGKTTLLRLIAGLAHPTTGSIALEGADATNIPVQHRGVGFVFQHYALFRHMTVADNIGYGLRVRPGARRPSATEIRRRALELLDLVQLSGLENRYPAQLSGGQRQRVALARALAIEPRVLLLDEPFGALDAQVRRELRRWLRELHDRTGHTTVFVTHDQEEALELSDRVVVMSKGRIEQVGTPDEVYDDPASPFVHGFIGESSMVPVHLVDGEALLDGRPTGVRAAGSGAASLYFRPHAVEITAGTNGAGAIFGVVRNARRIAGVKRLELAVPGTSHVVEIDAPATLPAAIGTRLTFRPTNWRIFPHAAGPSAPVPVVPITVPHTALGAVA